MGVICGADIEAGEVNRWRELAFELARCEDGRVGVHVPRARGGDVRVVEFAPRARRASSPSRALTELYVDCRCGAIASVRHLLESGVPADECVNADGLTPLHAAARGGHARVARLLLEYGAQPERADARGGTPLMRACRHGHADVASMLLDAGAHADHASRGGYTALMLGARGGHDDVVRLLCERSADVHAMALGGATARSLAAEGGHFSLGLLLRAHGAAGAARVGSPPRAAAFQHAWWYGPLIEGTRVAERVAPARPPRALPPPADAAAFAQRLIDRAARDEGLPHDGGRWRTRRVGDVLASEQAGARLGSARHATAAFAEAHRRVAGHPMPI